ncbi:MAG: hypothetical protein C0469_02030 [Cyanobacteria bacterium DS2.3.42]|nr:hypothetical protein [Cyanobacteria bacterium DS2.3.42]
MASVLALTGERKNWQQMVNETIGKMEVDKETLLAAIKAVKDKGLDINPFTVADEAKVGAQAIYSQSVYMELIVKERGSPLVVNVDEIAELNKTIKGLESRVRQLQIQNEVLTMQQQTQYDLGHKLGVIEGKKLKAQEIAAQEAARALAGDGDIDLEIERKQSRRSSTETGESGVIQLSGNSYVPELIGQSPEPVAAARQPREDEGWDTPDVVGEAELLADVHERQPEIPDVAAYHEPAAVMESLMEAESEANAPAQELEAGIPTAVFLSAVEDQSEAFGDSYSQKVFNAARSGPFVASEFNPMLELSWKDLETVYHFRAKSLKDFSKQIQQSQPAPPPPPPAPSTQKVRVPLETNGDMDERHVDELTALPSETLTGDNWERFEDPERPQSLGGESYIQSPDETTQEPEALNVEQAGYQQAGFQQSEFQQGEFQQGEYQQAGFQQGEFPQDEYQQGAQEVDYGQEPAAGGFDLDSMDIFEGLDDYSNLEDIEIIQDVQLNADGNAPSDDELRDLIKNRIRQAKEVVAEAPPAVGAKDEGKGGLGSKFIGGKARPKPGETGQAPAEVPIPSPGQSAAPPQGSAPPPPPPQPAAGQSAGAPGFVRQVPPEIRKACMLLGVRPEEMTIESVTEAWKRQITSPGVHPDQGGDTESAIYLNTAKDTVLRWLYDQAPKLGKKWGPGGPKSGPGSKPGPPGKGPTPEK